MCLGCGVEENNARCAVRKRYWDLADNIRPLAKTFLEKTEFLDTNTRIIEPLLAVLKLLDRSHIDMAYAPNRVTESFEPRSASPARRRWTSSTLRTARINYRRENKVHYKIKQQIPIASVLTIGKISSVTSIVSDLPPTLKLETYA